ncbi:MAG: Jag N-terminal domain-containing protein [Eubacteriales bacterium]|nr:Jag N-terminal domain-containing protein [Eubacteriales bacterium]
MANIQCPECKTLIGDNLETCPFCGFPVKEKKTRTTECVSVTAKTLDIALENARKMLDADSLADIEYELLQMNKKGLFGNKPAIILARYKGE